VNRQVPKKQYTIVGDGKVARHISHYFDLMNIDYYQWCRQQSIFELQQCVNNSDFVLLLISDDVIEAFIQKLPFLQEAPLIHFSGSLVLEKTYGCHPLMTFGTELYDLTKYQNIPFVCDEDINFQKLFPKLQNQSFNIPASQKANYHAMCVMAGNFTQTLMRETSKQLHQNLDLPTDILFPYLLQNTQNFIDNPEQSATGPIQRRDFTTVKKNLQALEGNELEAIYKSFVRFSDMTPSFLRRQESHEECLDLKMNTVKLGDSCLRRNDDVLVIKEAIQ
jgi:hypothetical protein